MLAFAQGADVALLGMALQKGSGVVSTDMTEAKAAIDRGDKVLVLGGPAAKALGIEAPVGTTTHGSATVAIGATRDDTLDLAYQLIR